MNKYVQYGCGFSAPAEWLNFDSSPTLLMEKIPLLSRIYQKNSRPFPEHVRYGDIVKGLPVPPGSCKGIYCSHVLEHLSYDDFQTALLHTYDMLEDGGIFRCVVPDLKDAAEIYLASYKNDPEASVKFMENVRLGVKNREKGLTGFLKNSFGNSHHLWMWDEKSLVHAINNCGFRSARRCGFNDSEDPMFKLVEEADRFDHAVAIECRK